MTNVAGASAKEIKLTMAEQEDVHELYEEAVQNVETEIEFLLETFQCLKGRAPISFR